MRVPRLHFTRSGFRGAAQTPRKRFKLGLPQIAVVLLGFSLILAIGILATGLTATPRPQSRVSSVAHVVLPYVVWLILAADYSGHPVKPVRLVAIPVFLALVLRHLPQRRAPRSEAVAS